MMPEGPEVKAVVRDLRKGIGRRLHSITFVSGRYHNRQLPVGYEHFCASCLPATIVDWNCKGKFIYLVLSSPSLSSSPQLCSPGKDEDELKQEKEATSDEQHSIWITLGMTGRFVSEQAKENAKHIRWYMEIDDDSSVDAQQTKRRLRRIYYADTRNFGTIKFVRSRKQLDDKLQKQLGPDILSSNDDTAFLACCDKYNHWNVCKLLMDQTKIAGIGNYILAECLYRATIDPFVTVGSLPMEAQKRLFREAQLVARESYQSLVNNTTCDFEFQVYGRETTDRGETVLRVTNGPHGRTIWYTERQLSGTDNSLAARGNKPPVKRRVRLNNVSDVREKQSASAPNQETEAHTKPRPRASGNSITRMTAPATKSAVQLTRGNAKLASILATAAEPSSTSTPKSTPPPMRKGTRRMDISSSLLQTIVEPGWKIALSDRLRDLPQFQDVATMLEIEQDSGETVFPPRKEIFAALNLCPLDKLKVVIVGQDPYHGKGQGHGLAFSVRKSVRAPPSLQNIFRELTDSIAIEPPTHGNLEYWARQGVLLLNSVLTVREGNAYSHARKGWEEVTDLIIEAVCQNNKNVVFLLWGNAAAEKVNTLVDDEQHTIIRTSHPSPLGATKTKSPFIGSGCFRRANQALLSAGLDPIDWNVNE